jgi:hypothetical protein
MRPRRRASIAGKAARVRAMGASVLIANMSDTTWPEVSSASECWLAPAPCTAAMVLDHLSHMLRPLTECHPQVLTVCLICKAEAMFAASLNGSVMRPSWQPRWEQGAGPRTGPRLCAITCIVHQVIYTSPIECCGCFLGCGFQRGRLPAQVQRQHQHSPSTMLLTDGLHRLWRARALSCTAASHRGSPQIGMLCFSR